MYVAFGMWNKSFCNIISWCCTLVIKARSPISSSSTACHLLFSITFLEAFPTAAGNNQRLLLANSLRLSSFQFCEFQTIPEDKINTKLKMCVVVRGSFRRRSWIKCRYEFTVQVRSWSENTWSPLNGWRFFTAPECGSLSAHSWSAARHAQSLDFGLM